MSKLTAWLVVVIGIALILPQIGVYQLGTPVGPVQSSSGGVWVGTPPPNILGWVVALGVIVIGIVQLIQLSDQKRK